jgi:ribose transport system permease protein
VSVGGVADNDPDRLVLGILVALGAVAVAGALNGVAITFGRIPPIIATLATNAILLGAAQQYSHGSPSEVPANLSDLMGGKLVGIPNAVIIAAVVTVVVAAAIGTTVVGRRFVATGAGADASRASGVRVTAYIIGAYVLAGLAYGVAGIVLAGYIDLPTVNSGSPYLLATITAVVVGGTALVGGRGRIIGTAIAAVFLTQLDAFVSAIGAPQSTSLLIQSAAIAVAIVAAAPGTAALLGRLLPQKQSTATGERNT